MQKINIGMIFNDGVFLIFDQGYYRIATHLKARENYLQYVIRKNARENLIYTRMSVWDASSTYYTAYLEEFDMISVELTANSTVGLDSAANLVQIEKIFGDNT